MSAKAPYPNRAEVRCVARELAAADGIEIPEGSLFVFCEEGGGGIVAKYVHLARIQLGHFDPPQFSEGELHERTVAGGANLSIDGSGGYLFMRVGFDSRPAAIASLNEQDVEWLAGVVESKRQGEAELVVEMSPYDLREGCVAYVPEWCGWIEVLGDPEPFDAARKGVHVQIRSTELSGEVIEHRVSLRDWPLLVKANSIPKEAGHDPSR